MKTTFNYLTKLFLILGLCNGHNLVAKIIYVDHTATGNGNGLSWTNADNSVKHAITISAAKDTIKIAKGKYKEGGEIVIDKALTLIGGYDNGGSPTPSSSNITQISGENSYRVIKTVNTSGTYIYFFNLEVIEGRDSSEGAGIYNDGAALAFTNCQIKDNRISNNVLGSQTSLKGAGIHTNGGSIFINHSQINSNIIERIWNGDWKPKTTTFSGYTSSYYGAGIYASNTPISIQNSTIQNNTIKVIASSRVYTNNNETNNFFGVGIAIIGNNLSISNTSIDSNNLEINITAAVVKHGGTTPFSQTFSYNNSKIIGAIIYSYDCDVNIQKSTISSNSTIAQLTNLGASSRGSSNLHYSNIAEGGVLRNRNGSLKIIDCSIIDNSVELKEHYNQNPPAGNPKIYRTSKIYGGIVLYEGTRDFQVVHSKINSNILSNSNHNLTNSARESNTIIDGNVISTSGPNNHIINAQISDNEFSSNSNSTDSRYSCIFTGQVLSTQELRIQNSLISKNRAILNGRYNTFNGTTINSSGDVALLSSTIAANTGNVLTNQVSQAITCNGKYTCYNSIVSHNKNAGNELNVGSVGSTGIRNSFIRGQNYSGTGNFNGTGNPGFLDSNSNYALKNTSMLLEAGNSTLLPIDNYDIDGDNNTSEHIDIDLAGNPRIGKCEVDLGAYESFGSTTGIIYVDSAATGSNNGYSWTNAFTDLQDALNLRMTCSKVDTILIAEGTYYPTQTLPGSSDTRAKSFLLQDSNVVLIGGYKASTGSRTGKASILSGDIGTKNNKSDNCYHVLIHTFLDSTTHFKHVTIRDGNATSSTSFAVPNSINVFHNAGGGISGRSSTLKLSNIKLINNHANGNGGGIDFLNSDCDASMLLFENNSATNGGAYYTAANRNSTILRNSVFHNNSATNEGGAFYASASTGNVLLLEDSFSNNTSDYGGAIFAIGYSNLNITSNYFFKNMANGVGAGGGLFLNSGSTIITKSYFTENTGIGGAIKMENGNVLNLSNSTFSKTNVYNEGTISVDDSKLKAENCIFDKPRPIGTIPSSLYFTENNGLSTITNCIFNGDPNYHHSQAVLCEDNALVSILNTSFIHINADFGVIYNKRGATLTLTNTVFYDKIRDIRNEAATLHSSSSHNASRFTGTSQLSGQTGFVNIKTIALKDLIKDSSNLIGTDNIWGTLDDGLDLKAGSLLSSAGNSAGQPILDIVNRSRATPPSIGAHEGPGSCNFSSAIATTPGLFTSSSSNIANGYLCFCDANDKLLLALDTTGTGAVIPANGVQLKIGTSPTTSWINSGGIVANGKGGAIFNRQWEVSPTTQPTNPVKVKYFFTNAEFLALKDTLANHNGGAPGFPTTINTPSQINMYKITSTGTFVDPHSNGVSGIIIGNGATPSLTEWKYSAMGTDHCAEYLVSSFSGGGGGFGGGLSPLPVEVITFTANYIGNNTAQLYWTTASETNNSHFNIKRSYDGEIFENIGRVEGSGNSNSILKYQFIDTNLDANKTTAYYRIEQVDFNDTENKTNIQVVNYGSKILAKPIIYPNPFVNDITISNLEEGANISLINSLGQTIKIWQAGKNNRALDLSNLSKGIYHILINQYNNIESYKIIKQ